MKTKVLLLIAVAAVMTVSFASVNHDEIKATKPTELKVTDSEPIGGFVIEDKL